MHMHIKFRGLIFCVFDWQENSWGINFCGHGSVVGTIIVRFAEYASYYGLILVDIRIPQNPRKFLHFKNFYVYGKAELSKYQLVYITIMYKTHGCCLIFLPPLSNSSSIGFRKSSNSPFSPKAPHSQLMMT